MKKFTVIALCFVLTASLLTACRSKAPEETNSPTTSTTVPETTDATIPATMPTILPTQGTDATNGAMDATGGNGSGTDRQGRGPMQAPMG